jgi:predicted nuclease of restriction endonuclease-like (RecB) superfamily
MQPTETPNVSALLNEVKSLIHQSRRNVAVSVNAELTLLYWQVGQAINQNLLANKRAEYGKQVVAALAQQLLADYGTGFYEKNLRRMMQFAEVFPEKSIVVSLTRQFTWTHIVVLIPIKDDLKRAFYTEMCRIERWSVRLLRDKIDSMLYERTVISQQPEEVIRQEIANLQQTDLLSPDLVFKDTYILDFLGLASVHSEATLEQAIVGQIQEFILEMGNGFAFLERQKRISVDDTDYYLDLLFYHRKLRRLVAIDLKIGKFRPEHKGQMELYLRWLQRYEMQPGELPPVGLLLCSEGNTEHIELLMLDQSDIRVAQYLTELPSKEWFIDKLHRAIAIARQQTTTNPQP